MMTDASTGDGSGAARAESRLAPVDDHADRDTRQAVWRGWRRRCPSCGTGPMMKGYLTVRDTCTVCGEELMHHRADDGPAWATMLLVGHLMAPAMGAAYFAWRPDPIVLTSVFAIGTVALALWLLPRFKGLFVGFQWAKRMGGFGTGPETVGGMEDV